MLKILERRILGVDPGTNLLGYALISVKNKTLYIMEMGVLKMNHLENHGQKLERIFNKTDSLIKAYHPTELAIEAPFFGKNVQSMLKLGRAQGVTIAAAVKHKLSITEYAPKKIKLSVTGNGNASKEQVAAMLSTIFGRQLKVETSDISDALATAVCHYFQNSKPVTVSFSNDKISKGKKITKKNSSWSNYVKDNPSKIKE